MSTLGQFFSGGIVSYQTGYVDTGTVSNGTGEDAGYIDVTISSVNPAKSVVLTVGGTSQSISANTGLQKTGGSFATGRLTSATNLRLAFPETSPARVSVRWQVIEFG